MISRLIIIITVSLFFASTYSQAAQAKEKSEDIAKWAVTNTEDDRITDENFKD